MAWRLPLVAVVIAVARSLDWPAVRWFFAEAALQQARLLGYAAQRLDFDTVAWGGSAYRYIVPCTFIEIALGATVLGWRRGDDAAKTTLRAATIIVAVLAFNLVKSAFVDLLLAAGVPNGVLGIWVNGAAYAAIFVVLVERLDKDLA